MRVERERLAAVGPKHFSSSSVQAAFVGEQFDGLRPLVRRAHLQQIVRPEPVLLVQHAVDERARAGIGDVKNDWTKSL